MYLQTNQEYPPSSVLKFKHRYLQKRIAPFTLGHSTLSSRSVDSKDVVPPTRQCAAVGGIIRQRIFVSTPNRRIAACAIFPGLSPCDFFLIPTTKTSIDSPSLCGHANHSDGRDKSALQHSRKSSPGLFQRPPEKLEAVHSCRRKLLQKRSLASECNYTVLIFILSVFPELVCTVSSLQLAMSFFSPVPVIARSKA